jgi:hypothetical protein
MACTGDSLTDEQLSRAAELRYDSDWSWGMICQELKCSSHLLRAARESDRWEEACKPWEVQKSDLRRSAYRALLDQVKKGDTAAIKEALARTEGNVAEKHEVAVAATVATVGIDDLVNDDEGRALLSSLAARLCPANGDAADPGVHAD